jgi:polyA polymerase family protein
VTSKNPKRVQEVLNNYQTIRHKLQEVEEKDRIRNFAPPIDGAEIMALFAIPPSQMVGTLKERVKNAILDGEIPNEYTAARKLLIEEATKRGLKVQGHD